MKRLLGKRMQWVIAAVVIAVLAVPWTAFADNVIAQVNDVEATGDNTFVAGGYITASYWIVTNSGDGGDQQPGCNASDGSPATVQINAPAGITATPSSLVFSACGKEVAQTVTFTSEIAGDYAITSSVVDASGGGYNTNPSKFNLTVVEDSGSGSGDPVVVDTTAPIITPNVAGTLGNGDWYISDVQVSFSVVDAESAISSTNGCEAVLVNQDTAGTTFTCSATSAGGSASAEVTIKRDATAPVPTISGVSNFYYGFPPAVAPSASATDNLSGVANVSLTGYDSTRLPGTYSLTANANDVASNAGSATTSYTVMAWTLKGFYQPVDMGGVLNTVKGGSTVPLKFEIFAGETELTNTVHVKGFSAVQINCGTQTEDPIEVLATGGTSLRYDATAGQFIYNWQTPKNPGLCYKVTMTTLDGSSLSANFKLK